MDKRRLNSILFVCAMLVFSVFVLSACGSAANSIVSIEKTATNGLVDTYTITYSNGTTGTFTITNGKDGVDGDTGLTPTANGLLFAENGETASVVDYIGSGVAVEIPSQYNGKPVTAIANNAFNGKTHVKQIIIPDTVTSIGDFAFNNCSGLGYIALPDSVTTLGYSAFNNCTALSTVNLSSGLTEIGERAFANCSNLPGITIPDGVLSLPGGIFSGCGNLNSITMPYNFTLPIGYLFGTMSYTGAVNVSQPTITYYIPTVLRTINITAATEIPDYAFYGCTNLTSVSLPDNLTSIGRQAFQSCLGLKFMKLPANLESISLSLFNNCINLNSIVLPRSVTVINTGAFQGCRLSWIYYGGANRAEWDTIEIVESGNDPLSAGITIYYYSETQPTAEMTGNYWHYVGAVPTIWAKNNA
ncbi:MAG: leucine-rich repeat protein [Christensenellaceae bacterium]|jgi:hypothetical protein|nr:leucine-rich repeat protein [Christensenellaceae bacterium]